MQRRKRDLQIAVKTAFITLMPGALSLYLVYKAGKEIIKFLGV